MNRAKPPSGRKRTCPCCGHNVLGYRKNACSCRHPFIFQADFKEGAGNPGAGVAIRCEFNCIGTCRAQNPALRHEVADRQAKTAGKVYLCLHPDRLPPPRQAQHPQFMMALNGCAAQFSPKLPVFGQTVPYRRFMGQRNGGIYPVPLSSPLRGILGNSQKAGFPHSCRIMAVGRGEVDQYKRRLAHAASISSLNFATVCSSSCLASSSNASTSSGSLPFIMAA